MVNLILVLKRIFRLSNQSAAFIHRVEQVTLVLKDRPITRGAWSNSTVNPIKANNLLF